MANADVLPLIIFSLVFGGILTTVGERGRLVIQVVEGVNEAIMAMVIDWRIDCRPFGRGRRVQRLLAAIGAIRRLCRHRHPGLV